MREIKFRVIQKGDKPSDYFYGSIFPLAEGCSSSTLTVYKDDIVNQYTGLKDKNGKEIYEGDIVKCMECENYFRDSKTERIILVELYFDSSVSRYSSGGPDGSVWFEDIEIIGNIYENPELLETDN